MLWLLLNIRDTSYPKNYVRVVALTPVWGRASFTTWDKIKDSISSRYAVLPVLASFEPVSHRTMHALA